MIQRKIEQFKSGNFALTGQWDEPNVHVGSGPGPAILFAHGFTGHRFESRRMYARLSASLAAKGISTFRFDHRGCGESEGDFIDFTPKGLLEDLNAALSVFLQNPSVDKAKTAVVGYSLGGLSASYWLHLRPQFVTAVLWAPVARPEIIRERLATYPDFTSYAEKGYFDYLGFRVSSEYIDNIGHLTPIQWVTSYGRPLLIIQGAVDTIVKPEQAESYMAARGNRDDRLVMIPEGDHAFGVADNIDAVLELSEQWLVDKLTS